MFIMILCLPRGRLDCSSLKILLPRRHLRLAVVRVSVGSRVHMPSHPISSATQSRLSGTVWVAGTSVDSGVSSPFPLLSATLSSGVACPETPFWSMSMGSTIVGRDVWMLDVLFSNHTKCGVENFCRWMG